MLTAESFVEFDAEKVKSFMELAEQVKYIKQMHLVCDTFKHRAADSWELGRVRIPPTNVHAAVSPG